MRKDKAVKVIILSVIAIVSLTNLFGLAAAGISVILGVFAFFVFNRLENKTIKDNGLDLRSINKELRQPFMWLWIIMPTIMNFLVIFIAKLILPRYIDHVVSRSVGMLTVTNLPILVIQLLFFALGEEIAWRGFFQKQLQSFMTYIPTILITSTLFSLGHLINGPIIIVAYDLLFVFVNSLIYGIIFRKTNSVWMSTISHFAANLFAIIVLFLL